MFAMVGGDPSRFPVAGEDDEGEETVTLTNLLVAPAIVRKAASLDESFVTSIKRKMSVCISPIQHFTCILSVTS